MAGSILEVLYDLTGHAGKLGIEHIFRRLQQPPPRENPQPDSMPELPRLPRLPRLPTLSSAMTVPPQLKRSVPPAAAGPDMPPLSSYAAEMDDPSAACLPCTRAHVSCMAEAARAIQASDDPLAWRDNLAVIAGEALVMIRYDWGPAQLSRADQRTRDVLEAIGPSLQKMLARTPQAPQRLILAWAATAEALRFARSERPTARDQAEITRRMTDVEGWINYLERVELAGQEQEIPGALRAVRHRLAREGYSVGALTYAAKILRPAVVDMAPAPDRETAMAVAQNCLAIRDEFFRRALSFLKKEPPAPARQAHQDRNTRLPQERKDLLARRPTRIEASEILAPLDSQEIFDRFWAFAELAGINIRWRNLEDFIEGEYIPGANSILFAPAAMSRDNYAAQTLTHELAHALLHNARCDIYASARRDEEIPEEQEADLATLAVFTELGLPLEFADGTTAEAGQWEVDWAELKVQAGNLMADRVRWAASLLVVVAQGEGADEVADIAACPLEAVPAKGDPASLYLPRVALEEDLGGIKISMFFNDHPPAHFHAYYGKSKAKYEIETLKLLKGELPPPQHRKVIEWASTREDQLLRAWGEIQAGQKPLPIK